MESENPKPEPQPQSTPVSAAAWLWPIVVVVLAMMVLVAYIVSLKTAKEAAAGTIRETRETIAEIGEAAVTIAENFQQAKITETFIESLPEVSDAGEGRLEVATLENTKVFKRSNTRTTLVSADIIRLCPPGPTCHLQSTTFRPFMWSFSNNGREERRS